MNYIPGPITDPKWVNLQLKQALSERWRADPGCARDIRAWAPLIWGVLTNFFPFYFFFDSVEGFDRFRPLLAALAISFWGTLNLSQG